MQENKVGKPQPHQLKVTYVLWNENSLFGGDASLSELPPPSPHPSPSPGASGEAHAAL